MAVARYGPTSAGIHSSDHAPSQERVNLEFQREPVHGRKTMRLLSRHIRNLLRAGRVHAGTHAPDLVA
ncbi:hypothetical protein [Azospirillum doebereinerae]